MRASVSRIATVVLVLLFAGGSASGLDAQAPAAVAPTGQITGGVVDKATGRVIPDVSISVVGTALVTKSDLNGRFRINGVPVGSLSLVARLIGFKPLRLDSVRVAKGAATAVNLAMEASVLQLQEVEVVSENAQATSSAAGLLSLQQSAPSASDGISAEIISRSPDSDAGQAVTRITGVSVVDGKFVVVRGLNERYNSTLLNGVEVSSPEPQKRVIPLDVFQANLLESIVTTKAATPDRPGDFAGASIDIKTKEFPSEFTFGVRLTTDANTATTGRLGLVGPRSFRDELGFGASRRNPVLAFPQSTPSAQGERFAESLRNVWSPSVSSVRPNVSFGSSIGGTAGLGGASQFGYVASVNYSNSVQSRVGRIYRVVNIFPDSASVDIDQRYIRDQLTDDSEVQVSLGGIANVAARLGESNQLTFKNYFTRGADETYAITRRFVPNVGNSVQWPVRYIERSALQSALGGEHRLFGGKLTAEWKGSYSTSSRDEPENRSVVANEADDGSILFGSAGEASFRYLAERTLVGQGDISVPISLYSSQDGLLKFGGLRRIRTRDFAGTRVLFRQLNSADLGLASAAANSRSPEEFFSPEYIGQVVAVVNNGTANNAYASDDNVTAAYAMADITLLPRVRLTGGARVEWWQLNLFIPGRPGELEELQRFGGIFSVGDSTPIIRRNRDILPSANLTIRLKDDMNLRLAGFQSVSRPDARELSPEQYFNLSGECPVAGNVNLTRSLITNGDVKWEWYPRGGEVLSLGGFYKRFSRPTVTTFDRSSNGDCELRFGQARSATVYGAELDLRRQLDFLPGALGNLSIGANATLLRSEAILDSIVFGPTFGAASFTAPFAGQSNYLLNGSLAFDAPSGVFSATVLVNRFGDRVQNYGDFVDPDPVLRPDGAKDPDQIERGRTQIDARMRLRLTRTVGLTLSGRNLSDNVVQVTQANPVLGVDEFVSRFRTGRSVSLGMSYEF